MRLYLESWCEDQGESASKSFHEQATVYNSRFDDVTRLIFVVLSKYRSRAGASDAKLHAS